MRHDGGGDGRERERGGGLDRACGGRDDGGISERGSGERGGQDVRALVEAALAAEKSWLASIEGVSFRPDVDENLPHRPAADLDANIGHLEVSPSALDPTALAAEKAWQAAFEDIMQGTAETEDQSLNQTTGVNLTQFEEYGIRLNKLLDMQERLIEANMNSLESKTKKRKRSALVANASNSEQLQSIQIQSASSPTPVSPIQKRSKRICPRKSLIWKHFTTGKRGQDPIATCNHCGQVYSCDRSIHGTSTLWNHLKKLCPEDPLEGLGFVRKNQGTPKHTFSVEECRQALADMVIIDEMPFTVTEGVGFRRYSNVLQPRFEPPSRVTVARDCMLRYIEEKPKLKKILKNHRICLTTDTWTSKQNLCYMTLTAHWIDDKWNLQKRILNFCSVADHKGETLGKRVEECLLEWGIDCIFTITVDNAAPNDKMIKYLMDVCKDWKGIVLKHKFLHVRCCAHIVNLVVKSGLEEHSESIEKIRIAVRFVRSSRARLKVFKKCAELEKISSKSLLTLDLETRWNATYLMLESAEKFEKAFARLGRECKPYKAFFPNNSNPPDEHDWEAARRILCFLALFEKVTTRLSASLHITSSIVFHDIMLMHAKLEEIAKGDDPILASMASFMKLKFQKYWEDEANLNYLLFVAVILDPRYKLKYLAFCLQILYGSERGKQLCERAQSTLDELFGFYAQTISASSSSSRASNQASIHINVDEDDEENPWDMLASQFERHMEEIENESSDSELSRYLDDKREMRSKEFDILSYWKVNSNKYPVLSLMAKDVLAVPASTVPSESAFSTGGRICAQSWLHTSHTKVNARETAEEVQSYEDIREEFSSKECIDNQHHDLTEV